MSTEFSGDVRETVRRLHARSNLKGLLHFGVELVLLVSLLALAATVYPSPWALVLIPFIGSRLYSFLDGVGHGMAHRTLFANRRLNETLGRLVYLLIGRSYDNYVRAHMDHHRYLLDPDKDYTYGLYERAGLLDADRNLLRIYVIKPMMGYCTWLLIEDWIDEWKTDRRFRFGLLAFWVPALAVLWYFSLLPFFALYWLLPRILIVPALDYWSEIAEHYNTIDGSRDFHGVWSTLFLDLMHGDTYHYFHHLYPGIPSYNLPALRAVLGTPKDTALGVRELMIQMDRPIGTDDSPHGPHHD